MLECGDVTTRKLARRCIALAFTAIHAHLLTRAVHFNSQGGTRVPLPSDPKAESPRP